MNVPQQIYTRNHPGPWSNRAIAGFVAYDASILAGMLAIFLLFPGLSAKVASWPG